MAQTVEQQTMKRVAWRPLPLIVVIYFVAIVIGQNVSFASLSMKKHIGV